MLHNSNSVLNLLYSFHGVEPALDKPFYRNSVLPPPLGSDRPPPPPPPPPKKSLPALWSLGPLPVKPPRPPRVDLSSYYPTPPKGMLTFDLFFLFCFILYFL